MFLRIEGKEAEGVIATVAGFFTAASTLLKAAAKKIEWEADALEKRLPLTEEECQRDITISKLELDIRERKAKVEVMELDAREQTAIAIRAEAILRQRTVNTRSNSLNSTTHKKDVPAHPNRAPSSPAGNERRTDVNRGDEGKSPTTNLGDKLKSVTAS